MKKTLLLFVVLLYAHCLLAQLPAAKFTAQCDAMGLRFLPATVQKDFTPLQLDSAVARQYDYAVVSADSRIEYRYRLVPSAKDSAGAGFTTQYLFYEAAKIKAGYPAIEIKPYAKQTVAAAYKASGGYTASFKPGDWMSTNFSSCSCFSFYKEGVGMFIIYMLTNDNKILMEEKYAAGLVGILMFK